MEEISNHTIYELLNEKYRRVCLDYVVLLADGKYEGVDLHRKAIMDAFDILNRRFDSGWYVDEDKMVATKSTIAELLILPDDKYYDDRQKVDRNYSIPSLIPYWFAFLEPPQGTPYLKVDFIEFNDILFHNKKEIEVYRWNDDFSDYFDAGKEWWGTGLWTTFDADSKEIVVIGASLTD